MHIQDEILCSMVSVVDIVVGEY